MSYSIHQLAEIAEITVRTLHYYDEAGLLQPQRKKNRYRSYNEKDLLKLQQILFFRELDFSINEIKSILNNPNFDIRLALTHHRELISLKKRRLALLIRTIDKTISNMNRKTPMKDKELYNSFSKEKMEEYAREAKERWGHTEAYKQSAERVKKMTKAEMEKIRKAGEDLLVEIAKHTRSSPDDPEVQKLIARHYDGLRAFYEPTIEMYRGLGDMYVSDERFKLYFEKFGKGLASFMQNAMHAYTDSKSNS